MNESKNFIVTITLQGIVKDGNNIASADFDAKTLDTPPAI